MLGREKGATPATATEHRNSCFPSSVYSVNVPRSKPRNFRSCLARFRIQRRVARRQRSRSGRKDRKANVRTSNFFERCVSLVASWHCPFGVDFLGHLHQHPCGRIVWPYFGKFDCKSLGKQTQGSGYYLKDAKRASLQSPSSQKWPLNCRHCRNVRSVPAVRDAGMTGDGCDDGKAHLRELMNSWPRRRCPRRDPAQIAPVRGNLSLVSGDPGGYGGVRCLSLAGTVIPEALAAASCRRPAVSGSTAALVQRPPAVGRAPPLPPLGGYSDPR